MPDPKRKSPRLPDYDYSTLGAYLVTVCTRDRACLVGEVVNYEVQLSKVGRIVENCWFAVPLHFPTVMTDAFVVMPNHIHGIVW